MGEVLEDFIKKSLRQGHTIDQIRRSLIKIGWQNDLIDNALKNIKGESEKKKLPSSSTNKFLLIGFILFAIIIGFLGFFFLSGEYFYEEKLEDNVYFDEFFFQAFVYLDEYNPNEEPFAKFTISNHNKDPVKLSFVSGLEGISKETLIEKTIQPNEAVTTSLPFEFSQDININEITSANAYYKIFLNDNKSNVLDSDSFSVDVYPFTFRDVESIPSYFADIFLDEYKKGETELISFESTNREDKDISITFVGEIKGYSQKFEETIILKPNEKITKILSPEIDKNKINDKTKAKLEYKVYINDNEKNTLYEFSDTIRLYPSIDYFLDDSSDPEKLSYDLLSFSDIKIDEELDNSKTYKLKLDIRNDHDSKRNLIITPQTSTYDISIIPYSKEIELQAGEEKTVAFDVGLSSYLTLSQAVILVLVEDENYNKIKEIKKEIKLKSVEEPVGEEQRYKAQGCVTFANNEHIIPSDIWLFFIRGSYLLTEEENSDLALNFNPNTLGFKTVYTFSEEFKNKILESLKTEQLPYSDSEIGNFIEGAFTEQNIVIQELETRSLLTLLPTLFHERIHYWQAQSSDEEKEKLIDFYNEYNDEEIGNIIMLYMNLGGYNFYENDDSQDAKFYYLNEFFAFMAEAEEYPDQTYEDEYFIYFYDIPESQKISEFIISSEEVLAIYNNWKESSKVVMKPECNLPIEKLPEIIIE